ncbi:MAG: DUF1206 domain-containing protein [Nocardioides sp.]
MSAHGEMANKAERAGRRTENSEWFDKAVRFGLVVYGVVYLVLAWLGIQLAMGDHEGKATTKGAVAQLAEQPFGTFLIVLVALGMFLLVLWRLFDLFLGHREEDGADLWKHRASDLLKALLYGSISWSAVSVLMHSGGGGSGAKNLSSTILGLPGGQLWLTLIGLGILAYGASQIYLAWNEKYQKKLATEGKSGEAGKAYLMFGKVGYVAKGIAVGLVGVLFVYAAFTQDPEKSGTTDTALHKVLQQPFGPWLLGLLSIGIACYGLFQFARARHLSR